MLLENIKARLGKIKARLFSNNRVSIEETPTININYPIIILTWRVNSFDKILKRSSLVFDDSPTNKELLTVEKKLKILQRYVIYRLFGLQIYDIEQDDLLKFTFEVTGEPLIWLHSNKDGDITTFTHNVDITLGYSNKNDAIKAKLYQESSDLYYDELFRCMNKTYNNIRIIAKHPSIRIMDNPYFEPEEANLGYRVKPIDWI